MSRVNFTIRFPDSNRAQATQWANDLKEALHDSDPDVQAQQAADNPAEMTTGGVLEIALGSAALVAVAKGIQTWLERNQGATVEISRDGDVKATGLRGKQVLDLVALLQDGKKPPASRG